MFTGVVESPGPSVGRAVDPDSVVRPDIAITSERATKKAKKRAALEAKLKLYHDRLAALSSSDDESGPSSTDDKPEPRE